VNYQPCKIVDIPEIPVFFPCCSIFSVFFHGHSPVPKLPFFRYFPVPAAEDLRRRLQRRAMGLGSAADAGDVG